MNEMRKNVDRNLICDYIHSLYISSIIKSILIWIACEHSQIALMVKEINFFKTVNILHESVKS